MMPAMAAAFVDAPHHLTIDRPAGAAVSRTLTGRSLMASGWRLMWDGATPGRGDDVVRFTMRTRPADGPGVVDEMVQIGVGGAGSARDCLIRGLRGGGGRALPDRTIAGRRWTAWTNGDAGMSQAIRATNFRTVVNGACYAFDRVTYSAAAAPPPRRNAPPQAVAAARMDAILATIKIGRRR